MIQRQVRDQLFEPPILLLQLLESLDGLLLGSAVFLPPAVVGRRTDFQLLADFLHALASGQKRGRLAQLLDDLFGSVSFAFHVESSAALSRRQSLIAPGSTFGEQAKGAAVGQREHLRALRQPHE